jgi:tRNA threonylcarbamoyladenosine biosynthesis protein TsaE
MNDASTPSISLISHQPDETARWATALADIAVPGRVICLWGDVGAGKTFFARHLIQTLQARNGTPEDVPSPTFTLVQTYDAGDLEIWHADLYRLSGPQEVYELGLIAAFETAFCLIEWPDRLGDLIPSDALHMTFSHAADLEDRHCKITCMDAAVFQKSAQLLGTNAHV